jgi:hypothetical protein
MHGLQQASLGGLLFLPRVRPASQSACRRSEAAPSVCKAAGQSTSGNGMPTTTQATFTCSLNRRPGMISSRPLTRSLEGMPNNPVSVLDEAEAIVACGWRYGSYAYLLCGGEIVPGSSRADVSEPSVHRHACIVVGRIGDQAFLEGIPPATPAYLGWDPGPVLTGWSVHQGVCAATCTWLRRCSSYLGRCALPTTRLPAQIADGSDTRSVLAFVATVSAAPRLCVAVGRSAGSSNPLMCRSHVLLASPRTNASVCPAGWSMGPSSRRFACLSHLRFEVLSSCPG